MNRQISFSYLRVFSALAIIVLHTVSNASVYYRDVIPQTTYFLSSAVVRLLMWAVPCFVMATGALLLDPNRNITIKKLYSKYVLRILLTIVFFFFVYQLCDFWINKEPFTVSEFLKAFLEMFNGQTWSHVWYLYLILGIYFLLPAYRLISANASDTVMKYILLIHLVFITVLPISTVFGVQSAFYIHVSSVYPFYLFAGYAISKGIIKIPRRVAVIIYLIAAALTVLFTYFYSKDESSAVHILLGYNSLPVAIQSVCLFSLFNEIKNKDTKAEKVIEDIDLRTFGIYMVHPILIRIAYKLMAINPYNDKLPAVLIFIILIILFSLLSYIITRILQLIPGIRKIV